MHTRFLVGLTLVVLAMAFAVPVDARADVAELLEKMPAQNAGEFASFGAEFMKLGPKGVKKACDMLVPPGTGDDANVRYALSGLAKYVGRPGAEEERALFASAVVEALGAPAAEDDANRNEVKAFLIRLLQWTGKQESVAPLAAYLADERLCEPATQALRAIPVPEAVGALAAALPASSGKCRTTLIKSLGELRHQASAPELLKDAASEDAVMRRVALYALANIGDPSAKDMLTQAAQVEAPYDRAKATSFYLLYAQRRAEAGDAAACEAICRDLLANRTGQKEGNVQCAALTTLTDAVGEKAQADLVAAMDSPNRGLRGTALKLAPRFPSAEATQQWVAKMGQATPEARLEIMDMLGSRGDKTALPALLAATKDADIAVRTAAVDAAVTLGGLDVLPDLIAMLQTGTEGASSMEDADIASAKAALMRLPAERTFSALAAALPNTPAKGRVAMLEVLAARRGETRLEAVFAQTTDADASVRLAALDALARVATVGDLPRLIALMLAAQDPGERATAAESIVVVAGQIENADERVSDLVACMQGVAGEQRGALVALMPRLPSGTALHVMVAETKSADAPVKAAAIQALSEWPDASAMPELLNLLRESTDPAHQDMAMRAYVRLASGVKDKLGAYKTALETAKRPEEKKIALGELGAVRTLPALELAATYLDDAALKADAVNMVVRIACPQGDDDEGLLDAKATAILKKAHDATDNADVKKKITDHLSNMPIPDEFNLAQGKAVKASVAQQGGNKPENAVDGKTDSGWYGEKWPSGLQVDLGEAKSIDRVGVWFYWEDGRHYQYNVDVSVDGENWTIVVDASANETPGTSGGVLHKFAPIQARYVRVNVLKNSANESVHLMELKVYAAGTAPVAPPEPQPDAEGFVALFNGKDLTGWVGDTQGYQVEDGTIACKPGGNLYTEKAYGDCIFRFEFKLTPGGNNGLGFHCPIGGGAYNGMELQILDNTAAKYKDLQPYQYHGSVYGVAPAKRGFLKPIGEWNQQEVIAKGRQITVILNGETIVDVNLDEVTKDGTMDHKEHKNLDLKEGHIGFLGHGDVLWFRNIRIKDLR